MTDYEVVVPSSAVKMETDEEGSSVGTVWLGDIDMVLLVVGVESVICDEPWGVDGVKMRPIRGP